MSIWEIIGIVASLLSAVQLVPEVISSWKLKNLDEIAWGTLGLVVISQVLWLIYGVQFNLFPVVLASIMHGIMGLSLSYLKIKYAPVHITVQDTSETHITNQIPIKSKNLESRI